MKNLTYPKSPRINFRFEFNALGELENVYGPLDFWSPSLARSKTEPRGIYATGCVISVLVADTVVLKDNVGGTLIAVLIVIFENFLKLKE